MVCFVLNIPLDQGLQDAWNTFEQKALVSAQGCLLPLANKKLILCLGDHTKHLALLELCPEEAFESNSRFTQEIVSKAQVCSPQPESQFSLLQGGDDKPLLV